MNTFDVKMKPTAELPVVDEKALLEQLDRDTQLADRRRAHRRVAYLRTNIRDTDTENQRGRVVV